MQALEHALRDEDVSVRLDFNPIVREAAANQIEICPAVFAQFLTDADPQVRIAVVNHSVKAREAPTCPGNLISRLAELQKDSSAEVRCALAQVLPAHAALPPKDGKASLTEIVGLVTDLLKDPDDDVRMVASLDLKELTVQFGYDFFFESFQTILHTVVGDVQWRVRINGMDLIFGLALLCNSDFFNQNIMDFLVHHIWVLVADRHK
jgi:hypothetical protein